MDASPGCDKVSGDSLKVSGDFPSNGEQGFPRSHGDSRRWKNLLGIDTGGVILISIFDGT